MADDSIASVFDKKAAPPLVGAETYRLLLEKLLAEGKGYGKTKPVAAYLMRDIELDRTDEAGNLLGKEIIEVKPVYIIMDLKYLPNEYGRYVTVKDIAVQYMKKTLGINAINNPDFKGQELWTAKVSAFESDYMRREGMNEYGKPTNIYDPNPKAYRLALAFNEAATIPTQWGAWAITRGGTMAVREADIPALAAALQTIRDGQATPAQALYMKDKDGNTVARFDVYGMAPGFLEENYQQVELGAETQKTTATFAAAQTKARPASKHAP